jgi:hypothetical protein
MTQVAHRVHLQLVLILSNSPNPPMLTPANRRENTDTIQGQTS